MIVTEDDLVRFVGGQVEMQEVETRSIYRGEIASLELTGDANPGINIVLTWNAKAPLPIPTEWVRSDVLTYHISFAHYGVTNIGPSNAGEGDRLFMFSQIKGDLVVLYPADGSKLDQTKVKDPQPAAQQ